MPFRRSPKLSTWRKVALVTWGAPHNPTAYGRLDLECDRALAYIDALRARTGERVYDKPSRCQIIVVRLAWLRV